VTSHSLPELPELRTWLGHESERSGIADRSPLCDPNTGEPLAVSRSSTPEQVERAIELAHRAHLDGHWQAMGIDGRAKLLLAMADRLDAQSERIGQLDSLNSGVPIRLMSLFAASNGNTLRGAVRRALALGDRQAVAADDRNVVVHRIPWGVTALLMPWNAPSAMAVKKLAYALAAGATVVMKPSPASPFSAELVAAAAADAGVPHGVVNLVLGGAEVGHQLVSDRRVRAISMTGSTPAGRRVAATGGANRARLRLELGSNNPAVVRADADIAQAASQIVAGAMKLSGQWCEAPRRVIVDVARQDALVDAMHAELVKLRVGSSLDVTTDLGPVAFEGRRTELRSQRDSLLAQGARLIEATPIPERGWFVAPTLAVGPQVDVGMEIFGPLITVQPSRSDDHAVALANGGHVGLAAYVFGADIAGAAALGVKLCGGEVKVNGTSLLDMSPQSVQSFFGDSGIGGHGDADLLDFHTGHRIVGTDAPGLPL
jgi:betaine-aldehyde dehydrogenase